MFIVDASIHMWLVLGLIVSAFYFFTRDDIPIEYTSLCIVAILLVMGEVLPLYDPVNGENLLNAEDILAGFANPTLFAVLCLLVMGQALVHTAALHPVTNLFLRMPQAYAIFSVFGILILVTIFSAFVNNTPLVLIGIPVLQAITSRLKIADSQFMMSLSFMAILGGMLSLIGSSTNLLVSSSLKDMGFPALGFFEFTIPGMMLAAVGAIYTFTVVPRMFKKRQAGSDDATNDSLFIIEIEISEDSRLIGKEAEHGQFKALPDINVQFITRQGQMLLYPFKDVQLQAGDILCVSGTRQMLMTQFPTSLGAENATMTIAQEAEAITQSEKQSEKDDVKVEEPVASSSGKVLAEVMVTPDSRIMGRTIDQIDSENMLGCKIVGIQNRYRVVRRRLGHFHLSAGDILLVVGTQDKVRALRNHQDVILLAESRNDFPVTEKAPIAAGIFGGAVFVSATGIMPIAVAAFAGAVLVLMTGCLNVRQMVRALDRKIYFLVGAGFALGWAMKVTHGAEFIADSFLAVPFISTPFEVICVLFLLIAVLTNLISNNACAIIFTPIAVDLAVQMGKDPAIFAIAVVLAANCSFASPIGYKTNLLVMGPGNYRFRDFMKAGIPLVLLIWISYCVIAKFYYGL